MRTHRYHPSVRDGVVMCVWFDDSMTTACERPPMDPIHTGPPDILNVKCPFAHCPAYVEVLPTMPYAMIEEHSLPDDSACPASLMPYPLTTDARQSLREIAQGFNERQRARLDRAIEQAVEDVRNVRPSERGKKGPPPKSQPLRGIDRHGVPVRLGREPEPQSPDWYLGGRESEELTQSSTKETTPPPGTSGQAIGRGTGMASIGELAALVNEAGAAGAEARGSLESAQEALQRAKAACAQILGEASSETVQDMLMFYDRSIAEVQSAIGQIDMAHDRGQDYIGRLHS